MATARAQGFGQAVALWILASIATVFFLRAAAPLLIPIVLGALLSYALEPAVAWMERHRVPRLAGTSLVLLLILAGCTWGVVSLKDNAIAAIDVLPEAARRARSLIVAQAGSGPVADIRQAARELQGQPTTKPAPDPGPGAAPAGPERTGTPPPAGSAAPTSAPPGSLLGAVQWGAGSILAFAGHATVIFFLVFFLLLSGRHVRDRIVDMAGPEPAERRTAASILDEVSAQLERFLLVRLITSVVVALATWAVLAWMGVSNAAVWGILSGVFNSIPYFGPVIVSGGLLVVGLVQSGETSQAIAMAGAALAITSLEGWILTPLMMGKAERMSVLTVFLGLLVWTWIWGAWGTILAVPMLVVMKAIADHVTPLKPVGRLMAP